MKDASMDNASMGCELPENLRQYYLDAMGIVCWQEQGSSAPAVSEDKSGQDAGLVARQSRSDTGIDQTAENATWSGLEQAVSSCQLCEALCVSRTKTVFGKGNRQADLILIGEAPGQDEDQQGEPFVGGAGQLLTAMLKAIELDRQEVFITNILKCRPPGDRDPLPGEAGNCHDYLRRQIELIQPKAILAVGRIAAQNLLATDVAIGKLRGRQHDFEGVPVLVTYHPAYLLRKPSEKRQSWQDLLRLKELMSSWQ